MQEKPNIEPEPIATEEQKTRIPANERLIAFGIDFIICYLFGVLTTLIPFLNHWLHLPTAVLIAFLVRDYFFEGHGIGKNLFGLQVVDAISKQPAKLSQSIARNFILIVPFLLTGIVTLLMQCHLIPILDGLTNNALYFVSMLYLLIVLPLESYRVYARPDSLRKGDEVAGTMVIESPMDFSHFLPPTKK